MSPAEKLLAEWFWIDRWVGSSAFGLPMEARGVYREMLTQAWRRGARLPNDHEAIQRIIGATLKEWTRNWPLIERYWKVEDSYLVNETQQEVYADSIAKQEKSTVRAQAGAQARWQGKRKQMLKQATSDAQAVPTQCPPSPVSVSGLQSPEPSPSPSPRAPLALAGTLPRDHVQHGWCSNRGKCVPTFLHEEFIRSVGGGRQSADQRLRVFYQAVEHGWPEGPIGDDPVKLWRKEFAAKFPSVAPMDHGTVGRTAMLRTATHEFLK